MQQLVSTFNLKIQDFFWLITLKVAFSDAKKRHTREKKWYDPFSVLYMKYRPKLLYI